MKETVRLRQVEFSAGPTPQAGFLQVQPEKILILVGPNNSGKSMALREIEQYCLTGAEGGTIVASVDIAYPTDPDTAEGLAKVFEVPAPQHQTEAPGSFWMGQFGLRPDRTEQIPVQISRAALRKAVTKQSYSALRRWLAAYYTARFDGRTRFWLVEPKPTGDLRTTPKNHLWALFVDDNARAQAQAIIHDAFGLHFVIDPTSMQTFQIRLSKRAPQAISEEQGLDSAARAFHGEAVPISDFGDGVQAFVGLISAVLSLPHTILLIDEPEAFLHPPLARRLGHGLARIANDRTASLVIATHSADFVMGCLEAEPTTSVVRLTYERGAAAARALPGTDLAIMIRDPLLRSTGVLNALFHRGAVITEADADRVFYDEINRRLRAVDRGARDVLFLHTQGKDTVHRLVAPLRQIGVPVAAIVDLDLIEQGGTRWENIIAACGIPQARYTYLENERAHLQAAFAALSGPQYGRKPLKGKGVSALPIQEKRRAEELLAELSSYGLFVVPVGDLESWLAHLNVSGHGPEWLVRIFARMGQSESDPNYVDAGNDDVWHFLDGIAQWFDDTNRHGLT